MAYTPQPPTKGVVSAESHPNYEPLSAEYYTGFAQGQRDAQLDDYTAHEIWADMGNRFMRGTIGSDYWYGYQQGSGIGKAKPGYPGRRP